MVPPEKGTQPGDLDGGTALESALDRCKGCHDSASTTEPSLYMPFDGWISSMMGNSARDPLFRAALAVANQDAPGVGSWCLRCHSPQAYVRGHTARPDGGDFDSLDLEGVTCEVCHRSVIAGGGPYTSNAQLYFDPGPFKHGPYAGISSPAHEGQQDPFTGASELCGQCHSVHSPFGAWLDADGGPIATRFPLDTTYEEWKQSRFASDPPDAGFMSCADCHLPRFTGPDGGTDYVVAKLGPSRTAPRRHLLAGGNVWGVRALRSSNPDLATDYAPQLDLTEQLAAATLRSGVVLSLVAPQSAPAGSTASLQVRVQNLAGHKFPTGYADGRRLVVQVLADGVVVSGAFDGGTLLADSQLRVYEALHGRAGQGVEEHLALHDTVVKDSRIPPAGLVPTLHTRPIGVTWFDLSDGGVRDFDLAPFSVVVPPSNDGGHVTLTARLLWQSTTPEYVQFLVQENHSDSTATTLQNTYGSIGADPLEIATESIVVLITAPVDGGSAGGTDGGSIARAPVVGGCGCNTGGAGLGLLVSVLLASLRRPRRRR